VLNRVESTEYSQVNTVVYTQEFPITVPMVGIGRMSRLNARCLPLVHAIYSRVSGQCSHVIPGKCTSVLTIVYV